MVSIRPLLAGRASSMARLKTARAPEVSGGSRWPDATGGPRAESVDLDADRGQRRPVERLRCGTGVGEGHPQRLSRPGILITQEPEQQVMGAEPAVAARARFLGG